MRYHYMPIEMIKINSCDNKRCWGACKMGQAFQKTCIYYLNQQLTS